MDTKLRNFNSLKLKKTIAVILVAVLFFTSGLFICFLVKGVFYYNRYESKGTYTSSNVFYNTFSRFERTALANGELISCENKEDYLKTDAGKAAERAMHSRVEQVRKACDYLDSLGIKVYVLNDNLYRYSWTDYDGETHYFSYDGNEESRDDLEYEFSYYDYGEFPDDEDVSSPDIPETTAFDNSADTAASRYEVETSSLYSNPDYSRGAASVSEALRTIWDLTNGLNYGEKPKEELAASVAGADFDEVLNTAYANCFRIFTDDSSFRFAVFYRSTGKVATNCGVKATDDTAAVLKKLENSDYLEYLENGRFHSSAASAGTITSSYFYRLGKAARYGENAESFISNNDNIERAYFSFSPVLNTEDTLSLSKTAYDAYYSRSSIHGRGQNNNYALYTSVCIISFIGALCCCLYLLVKAGKTDEGEVRLLFTDKIPLIIKAGATGLLLFCFGAVIFAVSYIEFMPFQIVGYTSFVASLLSSCTNEVTALAFMLFMLILLGFVMSIIKTVRTRTFFKYTLCSLFVRAAKKILGFFRRRLHSAAEKIKKIYADDYAHGNGKKFIRNSIIVILAVLLFVFLMSCIAAATGSGVPVFFIALVLLAAGVCLVLLVICFDRIASGVTQIKLGSLTCDINTRFMPGFMRSTAEDISKIREGLKSAVDQAVKDQAMKSELITNVTHDLKTPLTSIITYVDLLKREGPDGEHSAEYIDVIDEKSQRLKKLVDDLVQASKASSGAIKLSPEKFDLCEFASQAVGEYADELKGAGIELILRNAGEAITVCADPELTGRIFENLVSNIKKYSLAGTRAYLEISKTEGYGKAEFKNISADPLNYDTQRLTERFYRGDSARAGEGSGLGLSIAEDLCKLQSGVFSVSADGDLFKASVSLPLAE